MAKSNELSVEEIVADEKKKLKNLENMVQLILQNKANINPESKTVVSIDMSPGEMKDFIALNENLMKLRRRIYGLVEW